MRFNMKTVWEEVKDIIVGMLACLPLVVGRHLIIGLHDPLWQELLGIFICLVGIVIFVWAVKR